MILFLKRDNVVILVQDWQYPFPPTTIYHRFQEDSLIINTYEFDYEHKDKYFYKFIS